MLMDNNSTTLNKLFHQLKNNPKTKMQEDMLQIKKEMMPQHRRSKTNNNDPPLVVDSSRSNRQKLQKLPTNSMTDARDKQ